MCEKVGSFDSVFGVGDFKILKIRISEIQFFKGFCSQNDSCSWRMDFILYQSGAHTFSTRRENNKSIG